MFWCTLVAMAKFYSLGDKCFRNHHLHQDLAPSDYILFPNMKKWFGGKKFDSNDEIIAETNESIWKG